MNLDQLYPYGFRTTLFDRLLPADAQQTQGLSLQELRESVASDLEDLLNSRVAKLDELIDDFPLAKKSILQFGIIDFVGLSTANPSDRDKICQSIEQSIAAHEPRLKQIRVEMLMDGHNMGALCLSIQAYLNIHPLYEPVIFDALLKPTTQQYVISPRA
ncbi:MULTISPECIES: type VI secretion system baseplate subunit TssE [Acinetobacter]|uniref:Type VI secretion protein n=1 Tax=Acinetobacter amyesii TaxID=2942470 RepID=A0A1T1GUT9_9GAMM|nr:MULTISPECIES: type VI secretion system baseplate subunit TssE [Acinetobacter]MCL6231600.1 type VI secretion system baseplate subunit TssE [Acinetobacter amyesii]MCL6233877.1 type VI secretion system baseplate subunit TssE [Acinetobacter amyesii]MCL6238825.1 type VI secretion system baseplate subunit TssE [Acinetobacter amyesii]MCL6239979.1 type VI secretion system baseplate subunit TssE [Acinetobacter amyesii]MCL6243320.1 type VI secretion system baseplate subunit TssE [Acinetobacter amyesi